MFKLARFAVRYPTTVAMAVLAVLLLGYISYQRLGMDLLPRINNPQLYVEVAAGERPPEEMEKQFVQNLESLASRGRNVTNVISLSRVGKALITVEYQWNADMEEAYLDLQKAVADFGQSSGADSITVSQLDPNAQPRDSDDVAAASKASRGAERRPTCWPRCPQACCAAGTAYGLCSTRRGRPSG